MAVEISFTNPLPQVLEAVIFHVEGLGLQTARTIHYGWGSKSDFMSCPFFLTTLYILRDCHCHFLSHPQRYWQPRLRVSDRALCSHPARAEEITGFVELQAAHSGSRSGRHPRGGQKQRRSIADSKPEASWHWKIDIISLQCYLYGKPVFKFTKVRQHSAAVSCARRDTPNHETSEENVAR